VSRVAVIPTGTANLASVLAGLRRAGASPFLTSDADVVARSDRLVLPGVGTFGAAMAGLDRNGLVAAIGDRLREGLPTLGVCVGMQVLCTASEESPEAKGLGLVDDTVRRFPAQVRVPQFGWNRVEPDSGCRLISPGWAYFANSYRLVRPPSGWGIGHSDYGGEFVAAMETGPILALQFHPELSAAFGAGILRRWLDASGAST
jgi:imidazole glycerol phosphate synthase glutamine amidotransferase subunit